MTNLTKILPALLTLAMVTGAASEILEVEKPQ
jgi:hypothetical protein